MTNDVEAENPGPDGTGPDNADHITAGRIFPVHTPFLPISRHPANLAGGEPERADAARNRKLLLAAAQRLIKTQPVSSLTMEAVAHEAGVGKGTVFRRFGSRILGIDSDTAAAWGELMALSERKGANLKAMDGLLAATAVAHNLTLVTRNIRDFDRLGLRLLDPWIEQP